MTLVQKSFEIRFECVLSLLASVSVCPVPSIPSSTHENAPFRAGGEHAESGSGRSHGRDQPRLGQPPEPRGIVHLRSWSTLDAVRRLAHSLKPSAKIAKVGQLTWDSQNGQPEVQGYLAHMKTPTSLGSLKNPRHRPTVGPRGVRFRVSEVPV